MEYVTLTGMKKELGIFDKQAKEIIKRMEKERILGPSLRGRGKKGFSLKFPFLKINKEEKYSIEKLLISTRIHKMNHKVLILHLFIFTIYRKHQ